MAALLVAASLGAFGCGDTQAPEGDAAGHGAEIGDEDADGGPLAGEPARPPDIADDAVLWPRFVDWPCPPGWTPSVAEAGQPWQFEYCVPPARVPCGAGEYQPIDSEQCVRLGPACPAGGVRELVRSNERLTGYRGVVHHASDDAGLRDALASAAPGDAISLAVGEYAGPLRVTGVAIVGACASGVTITSPAGAAGVVLGPGGMIKDLTLVGGQPGVDAQGAGFAIEGVEIREALDAGVRAQEASGALRHVAIRGVERQRGGFAAGVDVLVQSELLLRDVVVERLEGWGFNFRLPSGGSVVAMDCVASEIGLGVDTSGVGLSTSGRGFVEVHRLLIDRAKTQGIVADGGARGWLQDVVVRHLPDVRNALAVRLDQVELRIDRLLIDKVFGSGIIASGVIPGGAPLEIRDSIIVGSPDSRQFYGRGIQLSDGLEADLSRVVIANMADVGLIIGESEGRTTRAGEISIVDLVVREIDSFGQTGGHGVSVDSGAQVSIERARIVGNRSMGLTAVGWDLTPQTRLKLADVVVSDTLPERCAEAAVGGGGCSDGNGHTGGGSGLTVLEGARTTVEGFRVDGSSLTGVYIDEQSVLRADQGEILGNAIGIYAGPGVDAIGEWFGDVSLYDNDTDYVHEALPLPDPAKAVVF